MPKMTRAKVAKEQLRLKSFIEQAQYEYNCAVDAKIESNRRWVAAKNELDAATEYQNGCQTNLDEAEERLSKFEDALEEFNDTFDD
jgi:predicted  nucleic acid-binding Zn-ribbon protein